MTPRISYADLFGPLTSEPPPMTESMNPSVVEMERTWEQRYLAAVKGRQEFRAAFRKERAARQAAESRLAEAVSLLKATPYVLVNGRNAKAKGEEHLAEYGRLLADWAPKVHQFLKREAATLTPEAGEAQEAENV